MNKADFIISLKNETDLNKYRAESVVSQMIVNKTENDHNRLI